MLLTVTLKDVKFGKGSKNSEIYWVWRFFFPRECSKISHAPKPYLYTTEVHRIADSKDRVAFSANVLQVYLGKSLGAYAWC